MVKPNLAFVNFFNETRGRRVVEIRDIKVPLDEDPDRWPEHHADFEKDTIYEIRWPHLPTEGSSSTSGLYEAYILCFGVTMEDLQHEAIGTGFKIPSADVATFKDVGLSPKTKSKSPVSKVSSRGRKLTKVVVEAPVEPPSHSRKKRKSTEEDITRRERSKAFLESLNCSPFVDDSESLVEPAPKESNKSSAASNNDLQVNVLTERRNNSSCRETQNEQSLGGHSKRSTSKGNGSLPELVNSLNCDKTNISKECSTDHERDSSESKSETKARERPSEHISDLRKPDQVKEKTSPLKSVGTSGSKKGSKRKERGRSRSKSESKSKARERPSEHISDHGITGESDQVNEKDSPFEIVGTTSAEKSSKHKDWGSSESKSETKARERPSEHISNIIGKPELVRQRDSPLKSVGTSSAEKCSKHKDRDRSGSKSESKSKARDRPSEHISDHGITGKPDQDKPKNSPLKSVGTSSAEKCSKHKDRDRSGSKSESKSKARDRPSKHISDHGITGKPDQDKPKNSPLKLVGTSCAERSSKHRERDSSESKARERPSENISGYGMIAKAGQSKQMDGSSSKLLNTSSAEKSKKSMDDQQVSPFVISRSKSAPPADSLPSPKRKKRSNRETSEDSSASEDVSFSSTDSKKKKDVKTDLYVNKILRLESELKKLRRENVTLKDQIKQDPVHTDSDSDLKSPKTHGVAARSPPPVKSCRKKLKFDASKPSNSSGDYVDNVTISEMILDAINNKAPLRKDGQGKVHIGNGVYISSKLFNDKIKTAKVSPTIAVRDVMGNIYSTAEMAERSLEGGTPVKGKGDRKKLKKKKLTPAKKEALFGLFRCKTMQKFGSKNKHFLDLAVDKTCKSTIRDKLKEAALKVKKEEESAAAEKALEKNERKRQEEEQRSDGTGNEEDTSEQRSEGTGNEEDSSDKESNGSNDNGFDTGLHSNTSDADNS